MLLYLAMFLTRKNIFIITSSKTWNQFFNRRRELSRMYDGYPLQSLHWIINDWLYSKRHVIDESLHPGKVIFMRLYNSSYKYFRQQLKFQWFLYYNVSWINSFTCVVEGVNWCDYENWCTTQRRSHDVRGILVKFSN